ncbi:MAG: ATP-binding protein, partial [Planctomycetales bacterium]|nr:ATP-binding protein [Planctomycetales bacterium]
DGAITLTWRPAQRTPGRADQAHVPKIELLVMDTGMGMKPDVLRRAFDPFFSYQAAGRNRGMGLATSHRIVEILGGRIWLESQFGRGTVAHVALPATRI